MTGRVRAFGYLVLIASCWSVAIAEEAEPDASTAAKRNFQFTYSASISGLPDGADVRVWIPIPPSDSYQSVDRVEESFPADFAEHTEPKYGNKMLYFETTSEESNPIEFSTTYHVSRSEVRAEQLRDPGRIDPSERSAFLSANSMVPIDGKPLRLLDGVDMPGEDSMEVARRLYDRVGQHMTYDKSRPGYGRGDSIWACDSRFGNCTDFHSLFISMARSMRIPARFEIGFPLPVSKGEGEIPGYHCWASFFVDGLGWVPVDISEADKHPEMSEYYFGNLTPNRIAFTQGRDLTLVPRQQGDPLNFFIYPYVEVNGDAWPTEKVKRRIDFKDR